MTHHDIAADQSGEESNTASGVRLKRANTMSFPLLPTVGRDGPVRIKRASSISLPLLPLPASLTVSTCTTFPEATDQSRCSSSGITTQGQATAVGVMVRPLTIAAATDSTAAFAASEKTHREANEMTPGKGGSGEATIDGVKDLGEDNIGGDGMGGEVEGRSAVAVEVGLKKKELPLLLRPLAGRCSFPGCGKVCGRRGVDNSNACP